MSSIQTAEKRKTVLNVVAEGKGALSPIQASNKVNMERIVTEQSMYYIAYSFRAQHFMPEFFITNKQSSLKLRHI